MEAILSRRSIRKYSREDVPDDLVRELFAAAMSAPSAGNEQPWHFIVIRDRPTLAKIAEIHPYAGMIRETPVAILVCGDLETTKFDGQYWVQDCAAATENLLIAVQSKGLGAVWLGVFPLAERVQGLQELLGIPPHVVPFALVPVGYPAERKPPANRYDEARIHQNHW